MATMPAEVELLAVPDATLRRVSCRELLLKWYRTQTRLAGFDRVQRTPQPP
jgi:hypothetical protein